MILSYLPHIVIHALNNDSYLTIIMTVTSLNTRPCFFCPGWYTPLHRKWLNWEALLCDSSYTYEWLFHSKGGGRTGWSEPNIQLQNLQVYFYFFFWKLGWCIKSPLLTMQSATFQTLHKYLSWKVTNCFASLLLILFWIHYVIDDTKIHANYSSYRT